MCWGRRPVTRARQQVNRRLGDQPILARLIQPRHAGIGVGSTRELAIQVLKPSNHAAFIPLLRLLIYGGASYSTQLRHQSRVRKYGRHARRRWIIRAVARWISALARLR